MTGSLRVRLLLATAVGTAAVLLAAGLLLYLFTRAALLAEFDRSLLGKAALLASTVGVEFGEVELDFGRLDMREFEDPAGPGYLQLWHADGSAAFRSRSLGSDDLVRWARAGDPPVCRWAALPGGQRGRAVGLTFEPGHGYIGRVGGAPAGFPAAAPAGRMELVLARDVASMGRALAQLRALLLLLGPSTVLVATGVLYWAVRRGLRPLDAVAAAISRLSEDDLSARVERGRSPAELRPVIERLNDLLGRLEAAFARERAFSLDVAHELRTPLAGMRSALEVILSRDRSNSRYRRGLEDVLEIAGQMQSMVERLLSLSRLEAGQIDVAPEEVRVNELLRECWDPFARVAEARGLRVAWALAPAGVVTTDRGLLGQALRSILENAVTHADAGGTVTLETAARPGSADVRVSNTGSKLAEDEVRHVFERFWRGDAARSNAGQHSGLGLSLARKAAEALGGSARAESRRPGEFTVILSVPSRSGPAGPRVP